jgi:D-alanyl-D-alanine carboxypeptidase
VTVSATQTAQETSKLPKTLADQYLAIKPNAPLPQIYAKNYALMDGANGDLLISQKADDLIPIASTTKMVTALVVVNKLDLKKIVTISKRPPSVQGSKINLLSGEKIAIESLLMALLINSGNDAAFALAEAYSGKEGEYQPFVDEMNAFVRSHGLTKSTFFDPAGLDDERGRSTVRELAHIARLVLQNETLRTIITTPQATIASADGLITHQLKNTNRLIQSDTSFYLPNAMGVKTGFTHDAGHSLVSAYKFQDRTLIGVVMNTVEYTNTASAAESKKLYLWADKHLEYQRYVH